MKTRTSLIGLLLAVLLGACGASGGSDQESGTTEAEGASDGTTETTSAAGSEETGSTTATSKPENDDVPVAGAGTANLTIGDMTLEMNGLTCYFDAEAAEASGDEDVTFAATAQDGDEIVGIQLSDMGIALFEVAYTVGDGTFWHMSVAGSDNLTAGGEYVVEDGRVAAEGEFDHIVDQEEVETVAGSVDATCG